MALLLALEGRSNHIIGGDLTMRAIGTKPGLFTLALNQYWDENKSSVGRQDPTVTLLIYRKNNPVLVERLTLLLREVVPLTFKNASCASLRQLNFSQGRYYADYQFDPRLYTDPGGYYMVWERCCRNDAITNVDGFARDGVAITFYLEFPPMMKNGVTFQNSSPSFIMPNGDYICLGKNFTFPVGATDIDGDQLRYSLVTPLNGYTTLTSPTVTDESPRNGYPAISWATGYGLNNVIPGSPPLRVDPATGMLSVRATEVGLYAFTVQCEEFRDGVRIGVVRRDFQLPVVDCSKDTPPPAVVMADGKVVSDIVWCSSQPLVLSVDKNPSWAYQWQKDGVNIRGSTTDTLQVRMPGAYSVVKSLINQCATDTSSKPVNASFVTAPPVKLLIADAQPYCIGDTFTLQALGQPGYQYHWQFEGKDVAGQDKAQIRVSQPGAYKVLARPAQGVCDGQDSIRLTLAPKPVAQIKPSSLTFCPDASVQLMALDASGNQYRWTLNGGALAATTSQVEARQAGAYQVLVTGAAGCTAVSPAVSLTQAIRPVVSLDSIGPLCLGDSALVSLVGQPAGGLFSGPGVRGTRFDPATAGVGRHQLTYSLTQDNGCRTVKSQWVTVNDAPRLTGVTNYLILPGKTIQLTTQASEPISRYQWSPPAALDRVDIASPNASPKETITYRLTATNGANCAATLSVLVEVAEALIIPSAFSPNSDGLNDVWALPNIRLFPDSEVTVYNRWGERVFFSKAYLTPWDGTYQQERVPAGLYTYQILTGNGPMDTIYRGQLMVVH